MNDKIKMMTIKKKRIIRSEENCPNETNVESPITFILPFGIVLFHLLWLIHFSKHVIFWQFGKRKRKL